jgi:hypothetical protein
MARRSRHRTQLSSRRSPSPRDYMAYFTPQHTPLGQVAVHELLKAGVMPRNPKVRQLVDQHIFQKTRLHQPQQKVKPDSAGRGRAGTPARRHGPEGDLRRLTADHRRPLVQKVRYLRLKIASSLIFEFISPFQYRRFAQLLTAALNPCGMAAYKLRDLPVAHIPRRMDLNGARVRVNAQIHVAYRFTRHINGHAVNVKHRPRNATHATPMRTTTICHNIIMARSFDLQGDHRTTRHAHLR